jgi:hypothetical protein
METKTFFQKLYNLQGKVEAISKDSTNPYFKSKYFDVNALLRQITPMLQEEGLLLLQPIKQGEVASIIIDVDSGEKIESAMTLPDMTDPQKIGSAITYYRRYTLQSLLALQAEDDDGNQASKQKPVLKPDTDRWHKAVDAIAKHEIELSFVKKNYAMTKEDEQQLTLEVTKQIGKRK